MKRKLLGEKFTVDHAEEVLSKDNPDFTGQAFRKKITEPLFYKRYLTDLCMLHGLSPIDRVVLDYICCCMDNLNSARLDKDFYGKVKRETDIGEQTTKNSIHKLKKAGILFNSADNAKCKYYVNPNYAAKANFHDLCKIVTRIEYSDDKSTAIVTEFIPNSGNGRPMRIEEYEWTKSGIDTKSFYRMMGAKDNEDREYVYYELEVSKEKGSVLERMSAALDRKPEEYNKLNNRLIQLNTLTGMINNRDSIEDIKKLFRPRDPNN